MALSLFPAGVLPGPRGLLPLPGLALVVRLEAPATRLLQNLIELLPLAAMGTSLLPTPAMNPLFDLLAAHLTDAALEGVVAALLPL